MLPPTSSLTQRSLPSSSCLLSATQSSIRSSTGNSSKTTHSACDLTHKCRRLVVAFLAVIDAAAAVASITGFPSFFSHSRASLLPSKALGRHSTHKDLATAVVAVSPIQAREAGERERESHVTLHRNKKAKEKTGRSGIRSKSGRGSKTGWRRREGDSESQTLAFLLTSCSVHTTGSSHSVHAIS